MSEPVIKVEGLGKRYSLTHGEGRRGLRHVLNDIFTAPWKLARRGEVEEFWALKDVSFEVNRGEVVGIIGRNGAGKSTLLKVLSRITEPTEGRVRIRGRVGSLLEVGTGFHPELTGRENIFLNGAILGMTRREILRKFDEIVAFAEVDRFVDTPVKRYSSGMYVRLAFAVAAHLEPEILIVDEVLAVGDAQFQKKCLGKMQEVSSAQGRTILFVSHQLGAIRRLCKSAVLLNEGRTRGLMSVDEALNAYAQEAQNMPASIDLREWKRPQTWAGGARLVRVSIAPEQIAYGAELRVTCVIEAERKIVGAVVGVGFDTLDGVRVMTLDSDNSGAEVNLEPGANEVTLIVKRCPMTTGIYVCSAAVFAGKTILDAVTGFVTWEALPGESTRGFAGCRPELSVEVQPK